MARNRDTNRRQDRDLEQRQSMDRPQTGTGVQSEQRQINQEAFGRGDREERREDRGEMRRSGIGRA